MFRIQVQSVKVSKLGNSYETVKSVNVETFNESLAESARTFAKDNGFVVQMYIEHSDPVPAGYSSKVLEHSTAIWKQQISSLDEALALFQS